MNKQWIAMALAFAMGAATGLPLAMADDEPTEAPAEEKEAVHTAASVEVEAAPAAAETKDEGAAVTSVNFDELEARMRESYYPVRAMQEGIDTFDEMDYDELYERLRLTLNSIGGAQIMMFNMGALDSYTYTMMEQGTSSVRQQFEDIKEGKVQKNNNKLRMQMHSMQDQLLKLGETMYINIKAMEAGDASAGRAVTALERQLKELELRQSLGQASTRSLEQLKSGLTQAKSKRSTLHTNRANLMLQLEAMVGAELGGSLTLGALPSVTAEQLNAMDVEKDLEQAREKSYTLYDASETLKDAKKDFNKASVGPGLINPNGNEFNAAKHTWQSAQYEYESAVQKFELSFRTLFAQVKDNAQALEAAKAAYADKQRDYAVSKLKYEQGNISKNAYADAGDALADARDAINTAERQLLTSYRNYWWAVERGVLE